MNCIARKTGTRLQQERNIIIWGYIVRPDGVLTGGFKQEFWMEMDSDVRVFRVTMLHDSG